MSPAHLRIMILSTVRYALSAQNASVVLDAYEAIVDCLPDIGPALRKRLVNEITREQEAHRLIGHEVWNDLVAALRRGQ